MKEDKKTILESLGTQIFSVKRESEKENKKEQTKIKCMS